MESVVQAPAVAAAVFADTSFEPPPSTIAAPGEYLSFRAGGEEYGLPILRVREIRSYEAPTRVANAPPGVLGVMNLRGVVLPIVDLRQLLCCGSQGVDDSTVVIVLSVYDRLAGVVVDGVSDVVALGPKDIQPAPEMASTGIDGSIQGIGNTAQGDDRRLLVLLDIDRVLGAVLTR